MRLWVPFLECGGIRTPDPRLWRSLLYQLSYTPQFSPKSMRLREPYLQSRCDFRGPGVNAWRSALPTLFQDFGNRSSSNRPAALANRKTHPFFHRNRMDQFRSQFNVIARHHHLGSCRKRPQFPLRLSCGNKTADDTL